MAEFGVDQAAGLRRLFSRPRVRIITFAAGSAGVGTSVSVANLASALAASGREVLVLDENSEGDIATLFGAFAPYDLQQVVDREHTLAQVITSVAPGVRVLPAARLVRRLGRLNASEQHILTACLSELGPAADVVLVDSSLDHPLGFSPLGLAAQEAVIVASPNGTSITEAYALIKKVSLGYARKHFRILVNKSRAAVEARAIHENIARVTASRGLGHVDLAGWIPFDEHLRQAGRLRQPIVGLFPEAPAAKAFAQLADELWSWPLVGEGSGDLALFVQQLLYLSQHIDPRAIYA